MSLSDFLGGTSQIKIIDFFLGDAGNSYNISELSELTGLTRMTLSKFIPELVQCKILEVDQAAGNVKTYRLAKNKLVDLIVASAYAYSGVQGVEPLDKDEAVDKIRNGLGLAVLLAEPDADERCIVMSGEDKARAEAEWSFRSEGLVVLNRMTAKRLRDELDEKIREYESRHGEIAID